ncbi:unnamed protein product [Boreogadus saida]
MHRLLSFPPKVSSLLKLSCKALHCPLQEVAVSADRSWLSATGTTLKQNVQLFPSFSLCLPPSLSSFLSLSLSVCLSPFRICIQRSHCSVIMWRTPGWIIVCLINGYRLGQCAIGSTA